MLIDSLVSFVPPGSTLSMVGAAGVGLPSNVIDLLGVGQGVAPPNIIGNTSTFGSDPGIDWPRAQAQISVVTALTGTVCALGRAANVMRPDATLDRRGWHDLA